MIEEYGVIFEYLLGKKQKNMDNVLDFLSRLDMDSLKIQEEKTFTLLSVSENSSINNIKLTIPMHTSLIFKVQAKDRSQGYEIMRKGLITTSLLNTTC
jgi:hypothetical protein